MTARQPAGPGPSEPAARHRRRHTYQTGWAVLSGTVLVICNLIALLYTVISWLMVPSGIGDVNLLDGAWFTAVAGMVFALATMLLTIAPVAAPVAAIPRIQRSLRPRVRVGGQLWSSVRGYREVLHCGRPQTPVSCPRPRSVAP
jgi:hypothetical protein